MMTKLGWGWWRTGRLRERSFQNQVRLQETPDLHQLWSTFSFFKKTAWITRRVRHKCSALQLKKPLNSPLPDASERVPRLTAYQDKTPLQFRVIANLQPQPPPPKTTKNHPTPKPPRLQHGKDHKLTHHTAQAGSSTSHLYHIQTDFELILPSAPKSPSLKRKNTVRAQRNNYFSMSALKRCVHSPKIIFLFKYTPAFTQSIKFTSSACHTSFQKHKNQAMKYFKTIFLGI